VRTMANGTEAHDGLGAAAPFGSDRASLRQRRKPRGHGVSRLCAGVDLNLSQTDESFHWTRVVQSLTDRLSNVMRRFGEILTVKELAAYLRCHQSTIYRLVRRGEIPHFMLGSDFRFERSAIERWIATRSRLKGDRSADL
jgi:excisionase family DNA binding protein